MNTAYKGYGFVLKKEEVDDWEKQGIVNGGLNYHPEFVFFGVFLEEINIEESPYVFNTPKDYTEGSQKYAQFLDELKESLKSLGRVDEKVRLQWLNRVAGVTPRIVFFTSENPVS